MQNKITLKQTVYNAVFEDIIEGRYKPNDIITEGVLVEKYGVSKAPVREALIELCKDNILQSVPRLGYRVVSITLQEIVDLLDFRVDLELCNLRKAAERMTDEDLENLRQNELEIGETYTQDVMPNWLRNQRFHLELCRLSGNNYTYKVLREALHQSSCFVAQYFTAAWSRESESQGRYHLAIIDALCRRNLAQAEEMLRHDILAVKQEIQQILR